MTVGVVHLLKIIHVQIGKSDGARKTGMPRAFALECFYKRTAVEQAGECVCAGEIALTFVKRAHLSQDENDEDEHAEVHHRVPVRVCADTVLQIECDQHGSAATGGAEAGPESDEPGEERDGGEVQHSEVKPRRSGVPHETE